MQKERRHPRKKTDRNVMCFIESGGEARMGRSYFFASLTDVSKNGVGLQTDQDCAQNDEVWLYGLDVASESIPGKVVWVKKAGDSNSLGLRFSAS